MTSRNYIVAAVVIALLMWGPVDHDSIWSWWVTRLCYLVLVPLGVWWLLKVIWRRWMPDEAEEDRLQRTIEGVLSGILLGWVIVRLEQGFWERRAAEGLYIMLPFSLMFFHLSVKKDKNPKD